MILLLLIIQGHQPRIVFWCAYQGCLITTIVFQQPPFKSAQQHAMRTSLPRDRAVLTNRVKRN